MLGSNLRCRFVGLLLIILQLGGCAPATKLPAFKPEAQPAHSQSQIVRPREPVHFSGLVLDSVSKAPIPSVLVYLGYHYPRGDDYPGFYSPHNYEAHTDAQGRFEFSVTPWPNSTPGYLTVNSLYFEGKTAVMDACGTHQTILLRRNKYRLRENGCQKQTDSVHIKPYASPLSFNLPDKQLALFIENNTGRATDTLRTIGFYVGKEGINQKSARLRIYRAGGVAEVPGLDLLTEKVILWCKSKEEAWYTIDLKKFNIVVPAGGVFVALEMLSGSDGFVGCSPSIEDYTPTGTVLRPPCAFADTRSWSYNYKREDRAVDGKWEKVSADKNPWPFYENAIRVEVSGRK